MGNWNIVLPVATTNEITNPSFEIDTTSWTTGGSNTIAQSSDFSFRGGYSLKCTYQDSGLMASYSVSGLTASVRYYAQARIYVPATWDGGNIRIGLSGFTGGSITYDNIWTAGTSPTATWVFMDTYIDLDSDVAGTLSIDLVAPTPTAGEFIYVDAIMLEQQASYYTDYVDGDQPGCWWVGGPHASKSSRTVQSRAGGQAVDLADYNFRIMQLQGVGMPPLSQKMLNQSLLDGSVYQGHKALTRYFLLIGSTTRPASTPGNYHSDRKDIIDAIKPDAVKGAQPFLLRYSGANSNKDIEIAAVYDEGLELNIDSWYERIAMRLAAHDPYFYEIPETAAHLDLNDTTGTANYIIKKEDNVWAILGTGFNGESTSMAIASDRTLYVGGAFTTAGGTTVNYIGSWDGSSWAALGSTGVDDVVYAAVVTPDDLLFITGDFANSADGEAEQLARWNGSSWSGAAAASGLGGGSGYAMAMAPSGSLYVGGDFTNVGGASGDYIVLMSRTFGFTNLGSGLDDVCRAIAVAKDGTMYAGGDFANAGGSAAAYIASWDGSAWSAMGSGLGDVCWSIAVADDGTVYAGGAFTTAGGNSANYVAKWNGSAWEALGTGMDGIVYDLRIGKDGLLYAGGNFTEAGGITLADGVAVWNGSAWAHLDINLPGTPIGRGDILLDENGEFPTIFLGFSTTGTATGSALTTVTNSGTSKVYPKIYIKRSGGTSATIEWIKNETTGKTIYMNYSLLDGEALTIDFRPRSRSVKSSYFDNVIGNAVLRASDLADFYLLPGDNVISTFVNVAGGPTMTGYMIYRNSHWSIDGVAA